MGKIPEPVHDIAKRDGRQIKQPNHSTNKKNGDGDDFSLPSMN